jgi:PPOX class probable F420-dependent enzyme
VSEGNLAELPGWALELLRSAPVAHLGILDDEDRPRVLPVTFALTEGRLYSAVDDKPKRVPGRRLARVRHLRRRPEAALTVDRYDDDWSKLAWVQVLGAVRIIDDPSERPGAIAALRAKYEAYGHRSPDGPLLELTPTRALHWRAV